jgi:hypothetical protein
VSAIKLFYLPLVLLFLISCASTHSRKEALLVEKELTKAAKNTPERKTTSETSTTGRAIQTTTINFLTDQPVFQYRDASNKFLLGRGYSQAMNLSTPDEFSMTYDGLEGLIHVEILAEVALPPGSKMTELPPDDLPKPGTPALGVASPPKPTQPPQGDDKGAEGNQTQPVNPTQPAHPVEPPTPTNIHKITIKISY